MIKLSDDKITVRTPQAGDEAHLVKFSENNVEHFQPTGLIVLPDDLTIEKWQKYITTAQQELDELKAVRFLIFHKDNNAVPIGKINYSQIFKGLFQACYLGYGIDKDFEGKGIMTRALRLTNNYMFEKVNLHRIMANYLPDNLASARLLAKLGFVIEGTAKDYLMVKGVWRDHVLTSLTNQNWKKE